VGRTGAWGVCVGQVVEITKDGYPIVDFSGNNYARLRARLGIALSDKYVEKLMKVPVLLAFENGDAALPIIVGFVSDRVSKESEEKAVMESKRRPVDVLVDGKTLSIDAEKEIILRCGEASIMLRSDGKVVVKGTQIISRASVTNKIKGGNVRIN